MGLNYFFIMAETSSQGRVMLMTPIEYGAIS